MVVADDDVWVSSQHFTDPITRVRKDSMELTSTAWRKLERASHVVSQRGDTIWLSASRHFDDSTLIRLDTRTGDHSIVVSGPNSGPYLFVDDTISVAGIPPDAMTIMSMNGEPRHVAPAPLVFEMQATRDAVFVLGNRGQGVDDRWLERRSSTGSVERVVAMPSAWSMAADTTAVWLAVAPDRLNGPIDVVSLDPETLVERGRLTVPGRWAELFPASPATAMSAY